MNYNVTPDMRMEDPIPTFTAIVERLASDYPTLAYISVIEPRVSAGNDIAEDQLVHTDSNDFIHKIWSPRPLILAGGFSTSPETLEAALQKEGVLVAYGRAFIANVSLRRALLFLRDPRSMIHSLFQPDLPLRLKSNIPLNAYDRSTFYLGGNENPKGYTDYPFADKVAAKY